MRRFRQARANRTSLRDPPPSTRRCQPGTAVPAQDQAYEHHEHRQTEGRRDQPMRRRTCREKHPDGENEPCLAGVPEGNIEPIMRSVSALSASGNLRPTPRPTPSRTTEIRIDSAGSGANAPASQLARLEKSGNVLSSRRSYERARNRTGPGHAACGRPGAVRRLGGAVGNAADMSRERGRADGAVSDQPAGHRGAGTSETAISVVAAPWTSRSCRPISAMPPSAIAPIGTFDRISCTRSLETPV